MNTLPLYNEPPKDVAEVKQRVISLLKQGWNNSFYALDERGISVETTDPNAVSVCLIGALRRSFNLSIFASNSILYASITRALHKSLDDGIVSFNDKSENVEQVIKVIEAIPENI